MGKYLKWVAYFLGLFLALMTIVLFLANTVGLERIIGASKALDEISHILKGFSYVMYAFCAFYWKDIAALVGRWRRNPELEELMIEKWYVFASMVIFVEVLELLR